MRSPLWPASPRALERLTIRTVLFLGFGLVFALWVVSGYALVRRLREVETQASAIQARFAQSEDSLFTLRAQVLLSAIYLRDTLLDPAAEDPGYYREHLLETRQNIEQALRAYMPQTASPAEREELMRLQNEVNDYWKTVLPVLNWEPTRRAAEARAFLQRQVLPKRELILRISERIQALNRGGFQQQRDEIARVYQDMRWRLRWTAGLAVLLGLGIAFLATHYAARLETRILQQHQQTLENRRDLQRLSARLVRAQEEERRAIARELHDEIGQALTAIKMDLTRAARSPETPGKTRQALEEARTVADRALQAVRDLSQLLHPSMLDDLGLPDTLNWYLRGFSQRTGIRTDLIADRMETRLATEVEVCAYRIVQEAMTNVARHAQASFCRIYLQRLPHTLLVTVEDNGKGFDVRRPGAGHSRRGLGLMGIQERVSDLGGTFRLESTPGKGTRLSVELPALPAAPPAGEGEAAEVAVPPKPVSTESD